MNGKEVIIDSRTSDAVALALRFKCPIYTSEEILKKSGIVLNSEDDFPSSDSFLGEEVEPSDSPFANYSAQELEEMLSEAIQNEDYEKASIIRDEIDNRKKN